MLNLLASHMVNLVDNQLVSHQDSLLVSHQVNQVNSQLDSQVGNLFLILDAFYKYSTVIDLVDNFSNVQDRCGSFRFLLLVFFSTFAVVDYDRIMDQGDWTKSSQRKSNHLGESLEQLHSKAFMETMSFDDFKMNRNRSEELFYLYERAVRKKEELRNDAVVSLKKRQNLKN